MYNRKYYLKRREFFKKQSRDFRSSHKEYYDNYNKEYYKINKKDMLKYKKQYYYENRKRVLEQKREYYARKNGKSYNAKDYVPVLERKFLKPENKIIMKYYPILTAREIIIKFPELFKHISTQNICNRAKKLGVKQTREKELRVNEIISKTNIGKIVSPETRNKLRILNLGHKHSLESRRKMSRDRSGNKNHFFGKHHSQKTKELIRKKNTGMKLSIKARQKISDTHRDKKHNQLWNKKISKSHKLLWSNPDYVKKKLLDFSASPTKPELQINQICKLNNLPFEYVADCKVVIQRKRPDFLLKDSKKIIEVNGDYWHTRDERAIKRDNNKKYIYRKQGYKLLTIWESEIKKDPQKVTEKIINFHINN